MGERQSEQEEEGRAPRPPRVLDVAIEGRVGLPDFRGGVEVEGNRSRGERDRAARGADASDGCVRYSFGAEEGEDVQAAAW